MSSSLQVLEGFEQILGWYGIEDKYGRVLLTTDPYAVVGGDWVGLPFAIFRRSTPGDSDG